VIIIQPTSLCNTAQAETGCVDLGHLNSYNLLYGCSHYWLFTPYTAFSYSHMWTATTERLSTPWVYCHLSCLTASFFSLFSLPVHQYPLQDQHVHFHPPSLAILFSLPLSSTHSLNQEARRYINHLTVEDTKQPTVRSFILSFRVFCVHIRSFLLSLFPFLCLSSPWVDIILIAAAVHWHTHTFHLSVS